VFVIDPKKVIRLLISYPAATGRNFNEILRSVQSAIIPVSIQPSFYIFQCCRLYVEDNCHNLPASNLLIHCFPFPALQLTDRHRVTTPANWEPGNDVVVHAAVPTEEARQLFPNLVEHKVSIFRFRQQVMYTDARLAVSTTSGRRLSPLKT
jgi:glutaredoxin/glutathione-dependent peroxiredoxin